MEQSAQMTSPDHFVQHNNYKPSSNHSNDPEMPHDDTRSKSLNGTTLSQASWMEHVEMRWNEDAAVLDDDDDDDDEEEWMKDPLDAVAAKGKSSSSMSATAKDESIQRQPLHHRVEIQFDRCLLEDNHDDAVDAKKKMHRLPLQHPKTPYSRTRQQTPQSLGSYTSSMFFPTTDWLSATWSFGEDSTTAAARAKDCTGGSSSNAPLDTTADSDSVSIASMAYFEPTDFQTSNWMQAMDAPTVGLAVIALTTVITHPLIFCLGALTALGAATAAARGYDLVSDGFWNKWMSSTLGNDETSPKASSTAPAVNNSSLVADSTTTLPQTLTSSAPSHTDTAATHMSHVNANEGEATRLVDPAEKPPQKIEATVSTVLDDPITPANDRLMTLSTLATLPDFEFSDQSFALYFPPLEHDIDSKDAEFIGLNVNEFFRVFLDDKAVYNFYELQKKRGDLDIKYGSWQQLPEEGPLSLYPGAPQDFPTELDYYYFQSRLLRFRAKTNAFLGPAYATTARTQRILILSKRQAIMEMKTQVSDIPFGDRFFVMERWLITSQKEAGIYTTKVAASCQAFFSQNCPFESQIRTKSVATVTDVFTAWCTMAAEALKLTEQAKHDRLLQQQQQHDGQVLDETGATGEFRQQRRRRQHASSETENHALSSSKPNVIDLSQSSNNNNKMSCSNDSVEVEHCLVQHQSYVVGEDRPSPAMIQTPNTNDKEDVIVASSRPTTGTARLTKNRTLRRSESAPPLPTQQQHQQQQRMQPFILFRRSWSRKPHSAASSPIPSL